MLAAALASELTTRICSWLVAFMMVGIDDRLHIESALHFCIPIRGSSIGVFSLVVRLMAGGRFSDTQIIYKCGFLAANEIVRAFCG